MSHRALALALVVPLAAAAAAPASAHGARSAAATSTAAQVHHVHLDPLNDSGVDGKAVLILKDGTLRVHLAARGLVQGMLHPQHIHGREGANATCPAASAAGDDGVLTLVEGLPFYGPVLQSLTPFSMADKGKVSYHQTFEVDGDLLDLSDEVIILHGGFVDGEYVPSLPVACGEIG